MSPTRAAFCSSVVFILGVMSFCGCGLVLALGDFQDAPAGAGGASGSSSSTGTGGTNGNGGTGTGGTHGDGGTGTGGTGIGGSGGSGGTATTCVGGAATCVDKATCGAATECHTFDCASTCCADVLTPDGTALVDGQMAEDCQKLVCDGKGGQTSVADPTDLPKPIDTCHAASCSGTQAVQTPIAGACTLNGVAAVCGDPKGPVPGTCVECNTTNDCTGGKGCVSNACVPAKCNDKVQDGDETDVDCGGSCLPCAVGLSCLVQADCAPGYCKSGVCAPASCNDGVKDGDETDVDCGGSCAAKCAPNQGCLIPKDCQPGPHGTPTCGGTCGFACDAGFADCDGVVGCEMDVTTPAHCGACNVACSAYCVNGACNDPVAIAGGYDQNCAILKDGTVYCWGYNPHGEVGDGTTDNRAKPTKVVGLPVGSHALAISAGGLYLGATDPAHTCAALDDQSVWCWGDNTFGQLGQGDLLPHLGAVKVKSLGSITLLSVRGAHTCAISGNKTLYCWGRNADGEIGNGGAGNAVSLPAQILLYGALDVGCGHKHTCIVKTDNKVYCWGSNAYGQLGTGTKTSTSAPSTAVAGVSGAVGVVGGRYFTCARTGTTDYCWGRNGAGELGIGNLPDNTTAQTISGVSSAALLAAGDYHVAAVTPGGVYMWGADGNGQLGDGVITSIVWKPELVGALKSFTTLTATEVGTCGLTATGAMSCWGANAVGQMGNGSFADSSVPAPVVW